MMRRRGFALALVLLTMPVALILAVTLINLVVTDTRFSMNRVQQSQAFYLAQSGLNLGFQGLANSNFTGPVTLSHPGIAMRDGEWVWASGPDEIRVSIELGEESWVIRSQGKHARAISRQRQEGRLEPLVRFAVFSAGDLSGFQARSNEDVHGPVHANGNLYLRPSGSRLDFHSSSVSAAGQIIRFRDAWGRHDNGGRISITSGSESGPLVEMPTDGSNGAFDSQHPDWLAPDGAAARWEGVVRDGAMGADTLYPPSASVLEPGGYYSANASLRIEPGLSASWLTTKTFFNQAEGREVTVREVDMAALQQAGAFPANGLVYSSQPLRLVNGGKLSAPLTVASDQAIYVKGDFNQVYPDATGVAQKRSAALLSRERIYLLTAGFKDSESYANSTRVGSEPSRFAGDPDKVLEVNAALGDGVPVVDERAFRADYEGVKNPYFDPRPRDSGAESEDYLENLGAVTVKKGGVSIHLESADMAGFDNTGGTPWIVKQHYSSPKRNYTFDPALTTAPPPFAPRASTRGWWTCEP